jgi:hypothetical protein
MTTLLRLLAFVAVALLIVSGAEADDVQMPGCFYTDRSGPCLIHVGPKIDTNPIDTSPAIISTSPLVTSITPAPSCDPGWALLQYPDTSIKVCAREMRAPR